MPARIGPEQPAAAVFDLGERLRTVERFTDGYAVLEGFCEENKASSNIVAAAKNIFSSWLYYISPRAYLEFIIQKNKIGDVYTPGISQTIEDFSIVKDYLPEKLVPHLVQYDEALLDRARTDKEGAKREIQKGIVNYAKAVYEFFKSDTDPEWNDGMLSEFVSVVTDGGRILGIGDQGAKGAYICAGKLKCYFLGSGGAILPKFSLPIGIDVGTDPKNYEQKAEYHGLRMERVKGEKYFDFVKLVLQSLDDLHVGLIQFEDFSGEDAWEILKWAKKELKCASFNDDVEGTAAMTAEALLRAEMEGIDLTDSLYFFDGAGGAASGISEHVLWWIEKRLDDRVNGGTMTTEEARRLKKKIREKFFFIDSVGPLCAGRMVKAAQRAIEDVLKRNNIKVDKNLSAEILEKFRVDNKKINPGYVVRIAQAMLQKYGERMITSFDPEQVKSLYIEYGQEEYKKFQKDLGMILKGPRKQKLEEYMARKNINNLAKVTLADLIACFGDELGEKGSIFLLGTSTKPGAFSEDVIRKAREMVDIKNPVRKLIALAMSNPTKNTEILTADEARAYSDNTKTEEEKKEILIGAVKRVYHAANGHVLIGTGSPFPEAIMMDDGEILEVAQANNIFIFPGIGLGLRLVGADRVTRKMWMAATQALFDWFVNNQEEKIRIQRGALYPKDTQLQAVTEAIAIAVANAAIQDNEVQVDPHWRTRVPGTVFPEKWLPVDAAVFSQKLEKTRRLICGDLVKEKVEDGILAAVGYINAKIAPSPNVEIRGGN